MSCTHCFLSLKFYSIPLVGSTYAFNHMFPMCLMTPSRLESWENNPTSCPAHEMHHSSRPSNQFLHLNLFTHCFLDFNFLPPSYLCNSRLQLVTNTPPCEFVSLATLFVFCHASFYRKEIVVETTLLVHKSQRELLFQDQTLNSSQRSLSKLV